MTDDRPDERLLIDSSELILVSAGADGLPHETPLRFTYQAGVVCLLAPPGADWYGHVDRDRGVVVRIRRRGFRGRARLFDARQRAQMMDQLLALFRRKYGAGAFKDVERGGLRPVIIDIQF